MDGSANTICCICGNIVLYCAAWRLIKFGLNEAAAVAAAAAAAAAVAGVELLEFMLLMLGAGYER